MPVLSMRRLLAGLLLSPLALPAVAAESYDACAGFIDTVPTTISSQGVWCLRRDLATSISAGAAITIATNNVTVDCNGFKLGGLAAGQASETMGVLANGRLNATVRNCAIRGFRMGVRLVGAGGGHAVEDNRIDQSLDTGIMVTGDGNVVQRNRVFDTGSAVGGTGIDAEADVRDNIVAGVMGQSAIGIYLGGLGTRAQSNSIRDLVPGEGGIVHGIVTFGGQQAMVDNHIIATGSFNTPGIGVLSSGDGASFCRNNLIANFQTGMFMCEDNGGNVVHGQAP